MGKHGLLFGLLQLILIHLSSYASAQTVFTYRSLESDNDTRANYEISVLHLALEKTVGEYGPYRLEPTPRINVARCVQSVRTNAFPNLFCSLGYSESYNDYPEMTYVRFPLDLGILGYRTCFTNAAGEEKLKKVKTLNDLKQLTQGAGRDWADVTVLRHNGFNVMEVDQYEQLFKMVAAGRFDLFCRGTNEVKEEYDLRHSINGLVYDRTIMIYYPMPLFLYANKANKEAIERMTKGLQIAYADGSLYELWSKKHRASVNFARLGKRKVFKLENPLIKSIDFGYERFNYNVESESQKQ